MSRKLQADQMVSSAAAILPRRLADKPLTSVSFVLEMEDDVVWDDD